MGKQARQTQIRFDLSCKTYKEFINSLQINKQPYYTVVLPIVWEAWKHTLRLTDN